MILSGSRRTKNIMSHFRSLSPDPSSVPHKQATSGEDKQELGYWAVWSLSSAKAGFGIHQLRDDDFRTYWQSDGEQPHCINIQFNKKMAVQEVALYLSYRQDDSYSPSEIVVRSGTTFHDLIEVKNVSLAKPEGWITISLTNDDPDGDELLFTNFVQIMILANHLGGRDTHVRQVKIFGPRNPVTSVLKIPPFESVDFTMYNTLR